MQRGAVRKTNSTDRTIREGLMIKLVIIVLAVAIAAVLGFAATRPDSFRVQRTATIKARPDRIFAFINDFRRWSAWSPYENVDPVMKRTYSGAAAGKGSIYEWEGNKKVGKGRMEILRTTPPSVVTIQLDFTAPFEPTTSPSSRWIRTATPRPSPGR